MSKGILGGVLGGEDEEKAAPAHAGTDAFAAAVATNIANHSPEVAAKTVAFFEEQTELVKAQRKSVEAEHAFFEVEWGPRLLGIRLRVGFQIFVVLVATVIGIGAAIVIYDAVHSRSVVIDPFDIAPNIATQVPSGKIVAAGLLDVLTQIQAANQTNAEHRALSNAWTNDITIEVPETGISFGQLERILKTRFGHDQHIDGDLVQVEKGGLALTVRGPGILPKTFTDDRRNLEKLLTQAGEYVYGQSQPGLWAAYLGTERFDDAISFSQTAYANVDPSERPYLLNAWANAIAAKGGEGANREVLPLYQEAVRLKPDYWVGYANIMATLAGLGDEEGAARVGEQMMKVAGGRPGRAPEYMYGNYDGIVSDLASLRAGQIADMESHGGIGTSGPVGAENLVVAQIEVQMHDVEAAALRLKTTPVEEKNVPDVAAAALARASLAEEVADLKAAAREWDAYAVAYANPTVSTANPGNICSAALTYEKTGQPAKADAALNAVGKLPFVDCYRFRGDLLDLRGDWSGAQAWYAKVVKLGPSIPAGYYSWGVALAKHGDLNGAAIKLKDANQKGPHWADPLKAWGDVLAKQGKTKDALVKYDEALKYAPNWKELKEAREASAKHAT
jgi:tetratricopeptide (TPR) repeat protein